MTLDPLTQAVRPDLADVRLAEFVFAPHYAEAMPCRLIAAVPLRRERGAAAVAELDVDERFEVLDLVGDDAWGMAPDRQLVGYVPQAALADAA